MRLDREAGQFPINPWPPGFVPVTAAEARRAQVERDEEYIKTMQLLATGVERLLKANSAINVYEDYFPDAAPDLTSDAPGAFALHLQADGPGLYINHATSRYGSVRAEVDM